MYRGALLPNFLVKDYEDSVGKLDDNGGDKLMTMWGFNSSSLDRDTAEDFAREDDKER